MLASLMRNAHELLSQSDKVVMFAPQISNFSCQNRTTARSIVPDIQFEAINQPAYRDVELNSTHQTRRSALLTLEAFRPRDRHYEKIIFFDSDMLCINSFSDAVSRTTSDISAVPAGHYRSANRSINTGFFILQFDQFADGMVYRQMIDAMKMRNKLTWGLDQPIINQWIEEQSPTIEYLPHEFNLKSDGLALFESADIPIFGTVPRILHFCGTGVTKPWMTDPEVELKYRKAYAEWYAVKNEWNQRSIRSTFLT